MNACRGSRDRDKCAPSPVYESATTTTTTTTMPLPIQPDPAGSFPFGSKLVKVKGDSFGVYSHSTGTGFLFGFVLVRAGRGV